MLNETFPRTEVNRSEAVAVEMENQPPELQVLIVDDEEAVRAILSFALVQEGYKVKTARDGAEALKLVKQQEPDIIILDLMLPGMDGIELCWRIRDFSDVPILMLTALHEEPDKVWAFKAGADDYLTKPFSVRELLARLKAILRRRSPNQFARRKLLNRRLPNSTQSLPAEKIKNLR